MSRRTSPFNRSVHAPHSIIRPMASVCAIHRVPLPQVALRVDQAIGVESDHSADCRFSLGFTVGDHLGESSGSGRDQHQFVGLLIEVGASPPAPFFECGVQRVAGLERAWR